MQMMTTREFPHDRCPVTEEAVTNLAARAGAMAPTVFCPAERVDECVQRAQGRDVQ
jgi:hypothetical protein